MRSLVTRRAALVAGAATAAAVALTGCSAGQVAETALKKPSVMGVNADNSNRSVSIRNLAVNYAGVEGYEAGADAPIEVGLFNETTAPITVLVSSAPAEGYVSGTSVGLVGGSAAPASPAAPSAAPSPSGSRQPAEPDESESAAPSASEPADEPAAAARPARIELAPLGSATFLPTDLEKLSVLDLSEPLAPGQSVNLVFEFSNGAEPLVLKAPMATPLVPASREAGHAEEESEGGH